MASHTNQPQFYRHLSSGIFVALMFCLLPAALAKGTEKPQHEGERSYYSQYRGEPFFLLSDTSYGSQENAKVRLEVPGRSFASFEQSSGIDIVLYRIADPFEFLKQQKNLHRIKSDGNYQGEGLANSLSFLWDDWFRKSRRIWQNIFTSQARTGVTREEPKLSTPDTINQIEPFTNQPQFALLQEKYGFKFVDRFRYPVIHAKPIEAPEGVKLEGSSSDFGMSKEGNVYIPLGKQKPGLYLVEAIVGRHRASTIIFVTDTVAITKTSAEQMMVWTARRDTGVAVKDVQLVWTDGVGVLANGTTDAKGIASFDRPDPEKSYVIGRDVEGGVLISENFYYDSEIYNTKIYAMTDRPLYRPGDEVNVKFLGRQFVSARKSEAVATGNVDLEVLDSYGTPVVTQKLQINGQSGAQSVFRLPDNATAGGYELRYTYKGGIYSAAFRVAEYIKPHFEITILPDQENFKTKDEISGRIVLTYPDGKPVKSAQVQLTVRAQTTSMVEGELQYSGLFPLKLQIENFKTDGDGVAKFSLPAAKEPSRYVLTTYASDGAAYRVKATKELLVERSASAFQLHAAQQFSQPNSVVQFNFEPIVSNATPVIPARYDFVQLESQVRKSAKIESGAKKFSVNFAESGSYSVLIYDDKGNVLGAVNHWVAGPGIKVVKGSVEIVFDHASYQPGETAEALITFAEVVDSALLTLERDRVEQSALLQNGASWISAQRVAPTQWRAKIKVFENFAPNMTFSVAYVKNSEWVFQNRGILVEQPSIQISYKTDKEIYQPGETVNVQLETLIGGKAVAANVSVGVVDEMIYVLQPEITPNIFDFFYYPRHNNVRTHSSLQFIGYDMASDKQSTSPARGSSRDRALKVLERPRRDNIDTAYWNGQLTTDSNGRASFTFVMPDSLTRWRITGRAMSAQGLVGQRTAYLRSEKQFYAKWVSPGWMRNGDSPNAALAVFNQTEHEQKLEISVSGSGIKKTETLNAKRGINTLNISLEGYSGDTLHAEIRADNKVVDKLDIAMRRIAVEWKSPRTLVLPLTANNQPLDLPKDASNIKLSFASGAAQQFSRIVDDLGDYPYGSVEQTASRMLPLSYALQSLPQDTGGERAQITRQLNQRLQQQRLRLVYMAGPNATFGWWGNDAQDDLLLTAYAYYADYTASRVLGLKLPASHWDSLLGLFAQGGESDSAKLSNRNRARKTLVLSRDDKIEKTALSQRSLALWMASDMGLPSRTLVSGLLDVLEKQDLPSAVSQTMNPLSSPALLEPEGSWSRAMTLKLAALLAEQQHLTLPPKVAAAQSIAQEMLKQSGLPSAQALLLLGSKGADRVQAAERILDSVRAEMPTFDRALTLIWLNKILAGKVIGANDVALAAPWQKASSLTGAAVWSVKGNEIPATLSLMQEPSKPLTAYVQYESASKEAGKLPVKIERTLYLMQAKEGGDSGEGLEKKRMFELKDISGDDEVHSNLLYMEEIKLTPEKGTRVRYGLVEAPLPPGAEIESGTWGIHLEEGVPLERATNQPSQGGYAVPVENLDHEIVVRHLLRFSQKGKFNIPPARFYSMYAPQNKAFQSPDKARVLNVK